MKTFLQIFGLVFVFLVLADCQESMRRIDGTVASDLNIFPRQYCGPQAANFQGGNPSPSPTIDITAAFVVPPNPATFSSGVTFSVWSLGFTGYVQVQSTLINGQLFRIGRSLVFGQPSQDWTPQIVVLPAIPGQTSSSQVSFEYSTEYFYTLEVVGVIPAQTG